MSFLTSMLGLSLNGEYEIGTWPQVYPLSIFSFLYAATKRTVLTHYAKKGGKIQYTLGILEDPSFVTSHCLVQTRIGLGAIFLVLSAKGFVQDTTGVQFSLILLTVLL